jgi:hypothetical protein
MNPVEIFNYSNNLSRVLSWLENGSELVVRRLQDFGQNMRTQILFHTFKNRI